MKISQESQIFSFLFNNSNKEFRPIEIAEKLGINKNSVRRALYNLRQKNTISKPKEDGKVFVISTKESKNLAYEIENKIKLVKKEKIEIPVITYYRKIVKGVIYCTGNKRSIYAYTYEPNTINREKRLLTEIYLKFPNCSEINKGYGYDDRKIITAPEIIFPVIEVGEEWFTVIT